MVPIWCPIWPPQQPSWKSCYCYSSWMESHILTKLLSLLLSEYINMGFSPIDFLWYLISPKSKWCQSYIQCGCHNDCLKTQKKCFSENLMLNGWSLWLVFHQVLNETGVNITLNMAATTTDFKSCHYFPWMNDHYDMWFSPKHF